jgi:hypothetical protein
MCAVHTSATPEEKSTWQKIKDFASETFESMKERAGEQVENEVYGAELSSPLKGSSAKTLGAILQDSLNDMHEDMLYGGAGRGSSARASNRAMRNVAGNKPGSRKPPQDQNKKPEQKKDEVPKTATGSGGSGTPGNVQ